MNAQQLPLLGIGGNGNGRVYHIAIRNDGSVVHTGGMIVNFPSDQEAKAAAGALGVGQAIRLPELLAYYCHPRHLTPPRCE